jgi:hypothetical protein
MQMGLQRCGLEMRKRVHSAPQLQPVHGAACTNLCTPLAALAFSVFIRNSSLCSWRHPLAATPGCCAALSQAKLASCHCASVIVVGPRWAELRSFASALCAKQASALKFYESRSMNTNECSSCVGTGEWNKAFHATANLTPQ